MIFSTEPQIGCHLSIWGSSEELSGQEEPWNPKHKVKRSPNKAHTQLDDSTGWADGGNREFDSCAQGPQTTYLVLTLNKGSEMQRLMSRYGLSHYDAFC